MKQYLQDRGVLIIGLVLLSILLILAGSRVVRQIFKKIQPSWVTYSQTGLSFPYPSVWQKIEDQNTPQIRYLAFADKEKNPIFTITGVPRPKQTSPQEKCNFGIIFKKTKERTIGGHIAEVFEGQVDYRSPSLQHSVFGTGTHCFDLVSYAPGDRQIEKVLQSLKIYGSPS